MTNNIGYGVVYTPDSLSEYVAALLLKEFNKDIPTDSVNSKSITILDPACGEGSLLLATEKALENQKFSQEFSALFLFCFTVPCGICGCVFPHWLMEILGTWIFLSSR